MGHNFLSDITPKNEVLRSVLKFGWLESYLIILPTKNFFRFDEYLLKKGGEGCNFQTLDGKPLFQTNITYFSFA